MRKISHLSVALLSACLCGCVSEPAASPAPDLVHDPFSREQAELREAVEAIRRDILVKNIEGLQGAHLVSDKFTKFGPRRFERQDVVSTNESEAKFFTSISEVSYEIEGLKIDLFGEVGVVTYYPRVSFMREGQRREGVNRQTLVFLRTQHGWKLVHEHGTPSSPTW